MRFRRILLLAGLLLVAALASAQVVYNTRLGVWAESDSAVYPAAARNLLAGDGLKVIQPSGKAATLMPLLAGFPVIVELYSGMMTEPLYLTLMLFDFNALFTYLKHETRGWLIAAALIAGLGVLTRFVGIIFLPAGALAVLLLSPAGWKRRLGDLLLFSAAVVLPVAICGGRRWK